MSVIERIAFYQNRRDEVPNQELAIALAAAQDHAGIAEIASHLRDRNQSVASDCIKVLYEIGYLRPELIQNYATEFLGLLTSKNNRMIWGAMIALSIIAGLQADVLWVGRELIQAAIRAGTVITEVAGIKTLTRVCAQREEYRAQLLPYLLEQAAACRPTDFLTRVETILPLVASPVEKKRLLEIIDKKQSELKPSVQKRAAVLARSLQ